MKPVLTTSRRKAGGRKRPQPATTARSAGGSRAEKGRSYSTQNCQGGVMNPSKPPSARKVRAFQPKTKEETHMVRDKKKFALWLTPETKQKIQGHYREDNCKSQSEFIEKAVKFYCGYLDTEGADDYLPRVLARVLDGKLGALGDRVGRLLFKLAVDDAVMANLVAATSDVDLDTLRRLRARCVREVKETNGQISFEDALKYQKGLE